MNRLISRPIQTAFISNTTHLMMMSAHSTRISWHCLPPRLLHLKGHNEIHQVRQITTHKNCLIYRYTVALPPTSSLSGNSHESPSAGRLAIITVQTEEDAAPDNNDSEPTPKRTKRTRLLLDVRTELTDDELKVRDNTAYDLSCSAPSCPGCTPALFGRTGCDPSTTRSEEF